MRILGHRGSPGYPRFGENTLTSFRRALAEGADGFELDVRRAGDGEIVVIHDATIDRTTNGSGRVAALTCEQLSRFDAGHGDRIPRLADVFAEFGGHTDIHVEVKDAGLVADIARMVVDRGLTGTVSLCGFDTDDNEPQAGSSWAELAGAAAPVPVALLATWRKIARIGAEGFVEAARALRVAAIHPAQDAAGPELVQLAAQAGLTVRVWTVNNIDTLPRWQSLGTKAIFTDFPGRCVQALRHAHP